MFHVEHQFVNPACQQRAKTTFHKTSTPLYHICGQKLGLVQYILLLKQNRCAVTNSSFSTACEQSSPEVEGNRQFATIARLAASLSGFNSCLASPHR